jgi:hypothetical protein
MQIIPAMLNDAGSQNSGQRMQGIQEHEHGREDTPFQTTVSENRFRCGKLRLVGMPRQLG